MILKIVCLVLLALVAVQANSIEKREIVIDEGTHLLVCTQEPIEIGIVLDSSASIWIVDFRKGMNFLKNFVSQFEIGAGATGARVSMITFGRGVYRQDAFGLSSYEEKEALLEAIGKVPHRMGDWTSTWDGINHMTQHQLSKQLSRPWAERVGIVITDGESRDKAATIAAAQAARADGIHMFAIGIGRAKETELLAIAGSRDRMFKVRNYASLEKIKDTLVSRTCIKKEKPVQTTCGEARPADIYFVFNPAELGVEKAAWTTKFITKVIKQEEMEEGFRFGVVSGNCPDDEGFRLDAYNDTESIEQRLSTKMISSISKLADRVAEVGYFESTGGREDADNVAVLVVDGGKKTKFLQDEVDRLLSAGTKVFVVDPNQTGVNLVGATMLSGTSEMDVALDLVGYLCPDREGDAEV